MASSSSASSRELERDSDYVRKKLGFGHNEFGAYLADAPVSHYAYPSYAKIGQRMVALHRRLTRA